MTQVYAKTRLPAATARRHHRLNDIRTDPSTGFTADYDDYGGSEKNRLRSQPVDGSSVTPDTSSTDLLFEVELPSHYVPGTDITIIFTAGCSRTPNTSATIDAEAYLKGSDGLKSGSDLCATTAIAITSTFGEKSFTVTGTGRVAGEVLLIGVRVALNDTGFGGPSADAYGYISKIEDSMSCYGGIAA